MLDIGVLVRIDRIHLVDLPHDLSGLLEAVPEAEARLKLFGKINTIINVKRSKTLTYI